MQKGKVLKEYENMAKVAQMDVDLLQMARDHITQFIQRTANRLAHESGTLLEVGPQDRSEVRQCFTNFTIETFDIVDTYKPTHVGDITKCNDFIPGETYDCIVCMDVIEHTLNPFAAVQEMRRILKDGGFLIISAPCNFRIHGPIPDCWRFTEHGFKVLLRDFKIIELDILETPGRDLFPVHYNILAINDKALHMSDNDLRFRFIE
jgi:SAM-dependent methyltransferase